MNHSHSLLPNGPASKTDRSLVTQIADEHAVRFGEGVRNVDCKAFPFFYNFTKYPYQEGITDPTTGVYSINGDSAEGPDGILIPAGGSLRIPIIMDNDYPYHLLNVKYGAYFKHDYSVVFNSETFPQPTGFTLTNSMIIKFITIPTGTTEVVVDVPYVVVSADATTFQVATWPLGASTITITHTGTFYFVLVGESSSNPWGSRAYQDYDPFHEDLILNAYANRIVPFYTELDVSLYFPSSGGRDLYGGFQRAPLLGAVEEQPLPTGDLQGSQDGYGSIRSPYQLPAGAQVDIRVKSRSSYPLYVYGHLFGYKITI